MPNIDWNQVLAETQETQRTVDPRRRLVVCFWGFMLVAGVILARATWLEMVEGHERRELAVKPLENRHLLPARRGKIVDRNGIVLAEDRATSALAVRYRYIENPPNERWLRSVARSRLTKQQRKDHKQLAAEEQRVQNELLVARKKLAELCGITVAEWDRRAAKIQNEVERVSRSVNLRRMAKYRQRQRQRAENPPSRFEQFISPETEPKPEPIIVREELDYHVMAEDVSPKVVRLIESQPEKFSGTEIVEQTKRVYPLKTTAAHILGYLGEETTATQRELRPTDADHALAGQAGLERVFDEELQGHLGEQVEMTDRSGRVLSTELVRPPQDGQTLKLTIDSRLQQTAEELLDQAILRRSYTGAKPEHVGGAAVVIDINSGEILAAASSPRFDPNWFVPGAERPSAKIAEAMTGPAKAMFNRVSQMALPPGSVFKIVTAVAALESGTIEPTTVYRCRGFMESEDAYRCQIYRSYKEGHGPIQLTDALGQSCNTYFFNIADTLGAEPILAWAVRLGLGQKTRVELPGESAGELPPLVQPANTPLSRPINPRFVAIGQERLRTTPLQIARMLAAVANQGKLPHPHLASNNSKASDPIPQLHTETLEVIQRGLEATVSSPRGTAYDPSLTQEDKVPDNPNTHEPPNDLLSIAGKTGTAQSGREQSDHAWFAAYAPANSPRYVVVVSLEHAGNSSETAVPAARRIFVKMRQLGLF